MTRMHIVLSSCVLALCAATALAQEASDAALIVDVDQGRVSVTAQHSDLSTRALDALRTAIQLELERSALRAAGGLHVSLRGEPLRTLHARLERVNLEDPRAVHAAVKRFMDEHLGQQASKSLTEPVEVIIGRAFAIGADSWSGSIVAVGARGRIDAPVSDLIAIGSQLELGPAAEITNRFVSVGSQIDRAPGTRVTGQELNLSLPPFERWTFDAVPASEPSPTPVGARIGWMLAALLASFGLGGLWLRTAPTFHRQVLQRVRQQPLAAFATGFAQYLLVIPAAVLLVLSVIGIALLPLYGIGLALAVWAAYVAGASWLGSVIARSWRAWQQLLLGLVLLAAVRWIPVAGVLVHVALVTCCLGALTLALIARWRGRRQRPDSVSVAVRAPAGPATVQPS